MTLKKTHRNVTWSTWVQFRPLQYIFNSSWHVAFIWVSPTSPHACILFLIRLDVLPSTQPVQFQSTSSYIAFNSFWHITSKWDSHFWFLLTSHPYLSQSTPVHNLYTFRIITLTWVSPFWFFSKHSLPKIGSVPFFTKQYQVQSTMTGQTMYRPIKQLLQTR